MSGPSVELLQRYQKNDPDLCRSLRFLDKLGDLPKRLETVVPARQRQRRLDPDERAALVADYVAGAVSGELTRRYRVHKDTVRSIVRSAGVERKRRHRLTEADVREAARLREAGASYLTVARHFGVGAETIRRHLLRVSESQGQIGGVEGETGVVGTQPTICEGTQGEAG